MEDYKGHAGELRIILKEKKRNENLIHKSIQKNIKQQSNLIKISQKTCQAVNNSS